MTLKKEYRSRVRIGLNNSTFNREKLGLCLAAIVDLKMIYLIRFC